MTIASGLELLNCRLIVSSHRTAQHSITMRMLVTAIHFLLYGSCFGFANNLITTEC